MTVQTSLRAVFRQNSLVLVEVGKLFLDCHHLSFVLESREITQEPSSGLAFLLSPRIHRSRVRSA